MPSRSVWISSLVLSFLLSASRVAASATELVVRCDGGEDLGRLIRALSDERPGPLLLHIVGSCNGPIEIGRDGLTLRGDDRESAAIEGTSADSGTPTSRPIITIRSARGVRLENLRIAEGSVGLRSIDAELTVEGCDVARTDVGIEAQDSTLTLARTTLHEARRGIEAHHSRVSASFGAIRDVSDEGLLAAEHSQVTFFRMEVVSDGLAVDGHSTLVATHSTLEGGIHAAEYSRVSLAGASGPTAVLRGDISASSSEVFLFRLPVEGRVRVRDAGLLTAVEAAFAETRLESGSHARVASAEIGGEFLAEGFSTVQLSATRVAGAVTCRSGADAVCEQSTAASVSGCPSCPSW